MGVKEDLFVRVPHDVQDYLMSAEMNITQFKIFNAVVRYSYGYRKEWCWLALSFLSDLTHCDKRQVTRELKAMLSSGLLLQRMNGKNRELKINPSLKGRNVTSVTGSSSDSTDTSTSDSVDTSRGDSTDTHIKKDLKEKEDKEKLYIFTDIMNDNNHLIFYNNCFKKRFKKNHMRVSEKNLMFIEDRIDSIRGNSDFEDWEKKVEEHFNNLPEGNDGNILPFLHASYRHFSVNEYN